MTFEEKFDAFCERYYEIPRFMLGTIVLPILLVLLVVASIIVWPIHAVTTCWDSFKSRRRR